VIFPNLREPKKLWGVSDLPQVMESQRELNRAMSQLSRILELSGNPIAVLENVEESEDIAVRPGAVWNVPEDAKAYLLDLLQGGGVSLHINYIDLVYRAMHDLSESPRSAFGGVERDMSGVALEIELQPLLQKVARKRIIRTAAYNRPFQSHTLPGTDYSEGLWREPVPFNCSCEYGLAMAHYGDYGWLASADGVWRALFDSQSLDLTSDVISLRQEIDGTAGMLEVELDNNDGKYASPGEDEIAVLDIDCQLEFSPGYRTTAGVECSGGQTYCVESIEHIVSGGKASVILRAYDGWGALSEWSARQQMRWNKTNSEYNVKDIIAVIIARVGIKLEVKSQSDTITNFYPDFTVNPNDNGKNTVQKLLSFVPDVVFIEGNKAYLVNPESDDTAEYSYGVEHIVLGGRYRQSAMRTNRVQVEGYDSGQGKMIVVDSFDWDDIERLYDRIKHVEDMNLNTAPQAYQRGEAILRKSEIDTTDGRITVPVNCGQQLYDVIEITDTYCGLTNAIRRVLGITLVYQPQRGEYFQRLVTGGV